MNASIPTRTDTFTPGAVFPLLLTNFRVGLVWLDYMMKFPNVQTDYGVLDAFQPNSSHVAPVLTWDNKITIVLALIDGALRESCDDASRYINRCPFFCRTHFGQAKMCSAEKRTAIYLSKAWKKLLFTTRSRSKWTDWIVPCTRWSV